MQPLRVSLVGVAPRVAALAHFALMLSLFAWVGHAWAQPIRASVKMHDGSVIVDVRATAEVAPATAWEVLTDYDHMTRFLSAVKSSGIVSRDGNVLQVRQVGQFRVAFMKFTFESLRRVELIGAAEIRSQLISGDFKSFDFTTQVATSDGKTVITHHGEYVPDRWIPPGIGPAMVEAETVKQYQELLAEMTRRQAESASGAARPSADVSAPGRHLPARP